MELFENNTAELNAAVLDAIRKMIKENGSSYEAMASQEQELTFQYAEARFAKFQMNLDANQMKILSMVSAENVYSNLGLLLSDQCPSTVKAATFSGTDQRHLHDRREFTGSLLQQMEELYAYLDLRNSTKATIEGLYRTDTRDYPEGALREAVMNAIVHRGYAFSVSTLVSVYDDRIELVSVGGLPEGIALEDIMLGLSVCRNPKLAAVFYQLKRMETCGTGIQKIRNAYKGTGLEPKFEATSNAFKIMLPNRNAKTAAAPQTPEQKVLAYLGSHETITRSEADVLLNVSQATSNRLLKRMVKDGLLYQDGSGRNTKYRSAQ